MENDNTSAVLGIAVGILGSLTVLLSWKLAENKSKLAKYEPKPRAYVDYTNPTQETFR